MCCYSPLVGTVEVACAVGGVFRVLGPRGGRHGGLITCGAVLKHEGEAFLEE